MTDADPDLEDALDGLVAAIRYAESIGEKNLARRISQCYQDLAVEAPDEDWDSGPEDWDGDKLAELLRKSRSEAEWTELDELD